MKSKLSTITFLISLLILAACAPASGDAPSVLPTLAPTAISGDNLDEPNGNEIVSDEAIVQDYATLIDALRTNGATVAYLDPIEQPFFEPTGQVVAINGQEVQVFEFADVATTKAAADTISPNGSTIGPHMMMWITTPHFYQLEKIIVLYVGVDEATTGMLAELLGQPVATGEGTMSLPPVGELGGDGPADPLAGVIYRDTSVDNQGLWQIDPAGMPIMMTEDDPQRSMATVSPDGQFFLFSLAGDDDVWLQEIATGEMTNLTNTPDQYETGYWWPSRPGVIIINYVPLNELGPWSGYLGAIDLESGERLVLDGQSGSGSPPALSPDGQTIAYDHGGTIWLYDWDTGSHPLDLADFGLTVERVFAPSWSPDGRHLAVTVGGAYIENSSWDLATAILDIETNRASLINIVTPLGGGGTLPQATWSPDGTWLIMLYGRGSWWLSDIDGAQTIELGNLNEFLWSPGSEYLLFVEIERGTNIVTPVLMNMMSLEPETAIFPDGVEPSPAFLIDWVNPTAYDTVTTDDGGLTLVSHDDPVDPLLSFEALLIEALHARDYALIESMMSESFGFAYWLSEGTSYAPPAAVEQLQMNFFTEQMLTFPEAPDFSETYGERGILTVWNPANNPVYALFSSGWGTSGQGEVFLIITEPVAGEFLWDGILYASEGFE